MTHYEYMKRTNPAPLCTPHDLTFGGRCLNCGYDPNEDYGDPPTVNTWDMDQRRIDAAVERFPELFGLYSFPGQTFRINRKACYVNDRGIVMLYTQILYEGKWQDFAKGTVSELESVVKVKP